MKKHMLNTIIMTAACSASYGQNSVGVNTNTPSANAVLELVSPNNNQGFLAPRLSTADRVGMTINLSDAENGLIVFDNDRNLFYYWNSGVWMPGLGALGVTPAGGDLSGFYPNPALRLNAVTEDKVADNAITNAKLADDAVITVKIADDAVTNVKLDKANIPLSGFGAAATDVALGSNKLTSVNDPTEAQDAATKNYVDGLVGGINTLNDGLIYVGDGSNMAQEVAISGDATISNNGTLTISNDAVTTSKLADDAVTNVKLDKANIPLSGFGAAAADVALGSNKLTSVNDPTEAQDAATKNYVDGLVGGINTLNDGLIYVGDGSNMAQEVAISGDATISNNGTLTISNDAVTTSKLADDAVTNTKLDKANIPLSGFGAAAADVTLGSNKLTSVNDPTDAQDAATKNYVDGLVGGINTLNDGLIYVGDGSNMAQEVAISGDATISNNGTLTISNDAVTTAKLADNAITTVKIMDDAVITVKIADDAVTNVKLDKANIPLSGFGAAAADVALGSNKLTSVNDPTDAQDAATKNYVDGLVGGINTLDDGLIYVGDGSNMAQEVAISGDATISNNGTLTISNDAVTTAKLADNAITTVKIMDDAVITVKIADDAVTNVKLDKANIPLSGFGAAAADVTLGSNKLTSVNDPTDAQDAATKNYVDGLVGGINTLDDGLIYVGDGSNMAQEVAISGDATISNNGTLTISNDAVTTAKLADNAITTVKIMDDAVITVKIADDAVTNTKLDKANIPLSGFGPAAADVTLGSNKLTSVNDPTDAQDAATKNYVDGLVGAISGDATISNNGTLTISNDAVTTSKLADDAVTNTKLDKANIPLSGFGPAAADVTLGSNKLTSVNDPTDAQDAATKNYVDGLVGGINTLDDGLIYVGDGSNMAQEVAISGDATISNNGTLTISNDAVTTAKLADNAITTVKIMDDAVITVKIADDAVTNVKLDKANIPLSGFGPAAADVALGSNKLTSVNDPTDAQDAATKNYVDGLVGGINTLNDGLIYVGDGSNMAQEVAISGDATISNNGTLTISNDAVTTAKLADNAITTVKIMDDAVITVKIADDAVTNVKLDKTNIPLSGFGPAAADIEMNGFNLLNLSDARFKTSIIEIPDALARILGLKGVNYFYNRKNFPEKNFPKKLQYGVLAQNLMKVFPELVTEDDKGYYSVNYMQLIPILLQALKEQQTTISRLNEQLQTQEERISALSSENEKVQRDIAYIKKMMGMETKPTQN